WESASARILAFLFASHPAGLRRDRVIDMLWPEVSDAKGNSLFHSTMYRLRMALSRDVIVYDDGVYRISPECPFRYDVLEFQRLARLARGDNEEAHVARLQAIDLYRSPFLETCDYEWCDEIRHSLQGEMQNLLLAEADYLIKANSPDEAELFYRRALGMDSYDERAHRGIMRCRAARQDRTGALRQFNECARILSEELDVEPSSATLVLYQRIRSGQDAPIASAAAP
ncbi:MAG: hypothetical protein FJZ90_11090, partial [Chloroflexi bacterium]|nr:hypothetical protein [Chloroflexota bacterium]